MPDILRLDRVSKTFQGFALEDLSFTLKPGFIMGLVGPNGSGKTTTIKLIMNMLHRDRGCITVDGIDNTTNEDEAKKRIGYVSDDNFFVQEWRTADVARAMDLYYDTFDRPTFDQYLERFDLPRNRAIKAFSRGMRARLMMAAALSHETRLLLLDEPTGGLDPAVRSGMLDILQEYISDGTRSVLFSTHITPDLERIADQIAFLFRGRLVFAEDKDAVLESFRLIKGRPDQLSADLERRLIGVRTNSLGFEGLIRTVDIANAPKAMTEPATLDDIVVFHATGRNQ